jgi:mono/diheme cytochrome c family protein
VFLAGCSSSSAPSGGSPDAGSSHDASTDAPLLDVGPIVVYDASTDRGTEAAAPFDAGSTLEGGLPRYLSQTGLYADIATGTIATSARAYTPQGVLWADGATKNRWVYLPPGKQIDTADMDHWIYPAGTKIWKEFSIEGVRIETRLIEKMSDTEGDWSLVAYQWKKDQSDAIAVPNGVPDAAPNADDAGTTHDIPASADCQRCHGGLPDDVLGFTAVQLSHTGSGVTLQKLTDEQELTKPPAAPLVVPGDPVARTALLYLHANCGQCHNERTLVGQNTGVRFFLRAKALGSVDATDSYHTAEAELATPSLPAETRMILRMGLRGAGQMPPLATKDVDETGVHDVLAWLRAVAAANAADAGAHDAGADAH